MKTELELLRGKTNRDPVKHIAVIFIATIFELELFKLPTIEICTSKPDPEKLRLVADTKKWGRFELAVPLEETSNACEY